VKLHLSRNPALNTVTSYGPGYVVINAVRYEQSLVVLPDRVVPDWNVPKLDALASQDIVRIAALKPELVLLGTGGRLHFPDPGLLACLGAAGIGTEVMDTAAACRTYNILAAEGRRVAAALIIAA